MQRRIAISVACIALLVGGLFVSQAGAATKAVRASGGSVTFAVSVRNAKTCGWLSSPKIAGFTANSSTKAKSYEITLTVHGKTASVHHWTVIQAGKTVSTTTTTTTAPPIHANVIVNVLDGQLLTDYLAFSFSGLPVPSGIDALPGDTVYLEGFATEPSTSTPAGTMSFSVNGSIVPTCAALTVQSTGTTTPKSEGDCQYQFNNSGPVTVAVSFQGSDGSTGNAQKSFNVASPDEVAIIDNECLQVTFGHC
jgi:hypothetical protein